MTGEMEPRMDTWFSYKLNEGEYRAFEGWFKQVFLRNREVRNVKPDFSNLKLDTRMCLDAEWIYIRAGRTDLRLKYSAVTELCRIPELVLFFAQKEFWAVPARILGGESGAREFVEGLESRRQSRRAGRVPLAEVAKRCKSEKRICFYYTRNVDQVMDALRALGLRRGVMQKLRRLSIFPYRYAGEQALVLEDDGLYEYGEKWAAGYAYEDLKRIFYTKKCLYLTGKGMDAVMVPMEPLGGREGMERLVEACNARRPSELPPLKLPAREAGARLCIGSGNVRRRGLAVLAAGCVIMGVVVWGGMRGGRAVWTDDGRAGETVGVPEGAGDRAGAGETVGVPQGAGAGARQQKTAGAEAGLVVTAPDDTVFDQVGEDGVLASSGQFYRITLPPGQWERRGGLDSVDYLESQWGSVSVRGYRNQDRSLMMMGMNVPKTKEEYIRRMAGHPGSRGDDMPEVLEYAYSEGKDGIVVRKETRFQGRVYGAAEEYRYHLELNLTSPEYFYTVTLIPKKETAQSIAEARRALDTFRVLDTSSGICRKMEEETFHGYYGKNIVMTSCLVLLEKDMSAKEIGDCLEMVKKIGRGFLSSGNGDALAARSKDSSWLGIDCQSLHENCTVENARRVSKIFKSDVILYDEFDGDLLMVAYCDKDRKHAVWRATSFDREILMSEFGCYGEEQEFPEELLKYMDITREEADAIWKDGEAVFQMDKWYELAGHITNPPVPEEFIGMGDYSALKEGFEVIRR